MEYILYHYCLSNIFQHEYYKGGVEVVGARYTEHLGPPLNWWEQLLANWKCTKSGKKKTAERTLPLECPPKERNMWNIDCVPFPVSIVLYYLCSCWSFFFFTELPQGQFSLVVAISVRLRLCLSVPSWLNVDYAQMLRVSVFCHKIDFICLRFDTLNFFERLVTPINKGWMSSQYLTNRFPRQK